MFDVIKSTVKPLLLDEKVLEEAYGLYLSSSSSSLPAISLKALSNKTGKSALQCRNAIVEAYNLGRFPACELHP